MDGWIGELRRGNSDGAWDLFLDRHRRLIFAAIRHYAQDYDDVMCHRTPGKPDKWKSISVGYLSASDHVLHGDTVGPCEPQPDDEDG